MENIKIKINEVENWFACSNGKIWDDRKQKFLKESLNEDGYLMIHKCRNGVKVKFRVHRLICRAFHGEPPNESYTVDHIDHVKINNTPENLRWLTIRENVLHYLKNNSTHIYKGGLTPDLILKIRLEYIPWHREKGAAAFAKRYGISASYMEDIINNRRRTY